MNTLKTYQELINAISDIADVESNRLLVLATIYTRKCQEIRKNKLEDFKRYFDSQIAFYKRSVQKYAKEYEKIYLEYEKAFDRVVEQYSIYYNYIQNEEVFAKSNQKIAIANFLVSKNGLDKAKDNGNYALMEKSSKKVFATAQKKLNYDIIIDECDNRLNECAKNTYFDLEEIFNINDLDIDLRREGCFDKFKNFLKFTFRKESEFKKYVMEPLKSKVSKIDKISIIKSSNVKIKMIRFVSQMENIRTDVNLTFNETLNKN